MKKLVVSLSIIVVVAAAGWWYFSSDGDTAASSADIIRTGVAIRGDLTVSISAVGTVEPIQEVEIKSKASGEIVKLTAEEGDFVHKSDLLVQLDPTTVRNAFDQAQADFNVAEITLAQRKRELQRQKDLLDKKLISESVYDDARLAYEQANSQFVRARATLSTNTEQLQDTEIRSPIDGLVLTREIEEGQIISSGTSSVTGGTLLYRIADMTQVHVIADVDETDIGRVQVGLGARVTPDAYPERVFDGLVTRAAPLAKVEQNVTMFEVTVLVDNREGLLKAGMNADVEMIIDQALDAVLVPVGAVQTRMARQDHPGMQAGNNRESSMDRTAGHSPDGHPSSPGGTAGNAHGDRSFPGKPGNEPESFVELIQNGSVVEQPVKIGLVNLDHVQILEGVNPGDSLQWSLTSGALAGREQFRERMRNRSAVPGMRSR